MKKFFIFILFFYCNYAFGLLHLVAAENFYGEVAKQLGGQFVSVKNIIELPTQDPHLFNVDPETVKKINAADIVVYNGAGYDVWIHPLLTAQALKAKYIIAVADLIQISPTPNPHIWYQPKTMWLYAKKLKSTFSVLDPTHQWYFAHQFQRFNQDYQYFFAKLNFLKSHMQGISVIATEPIFNEMADFLGLNMHGKNFQIAMMNDVAPSVADVKSFEDDLYHRKVRVLIYNKQVASPLTKYMLAIAKKQKIPILGVTETLPPGMNYIQWMMQQLQQLENALRLK